MPPASDFSSPLIRLGGRFPDRRVYAKCEFLAPSGCFKIHGARHLLQHLASGNGPRELIVPSMGNTALGAAVGAKEFGFTMTGVVPTTIARAKDERLRSLGVDLVKIVGGGSDLLRHATQLAQDRGGYFVHPHLDPNWTNGYQIIAEQIMRDLPDCKSIVFPVGGGGLLMGLTEYFRAKPADVTLVGVEPFNYPKYAGFTHARSKTIADGLLLEHPHPVVQARIAETGMKIPMVQEDGIRKALAGMYSTQGLVIEPSSAVGLAHVEASAIPEPACVILTGGNVAREDFDRMIEAIP